MMAEQAEVKTGSDILTQVISNQNSKCLSEPAIYEKVERENAHSTNQALVDTGKGWQDLIQFRCDKIKYNINPKLKECVIKLQSTNEKYEKNLKSRLEESLDKLHSKKEKHEHNLQAKKEEYVDKLQNTNEKYENNLTAELGDIKTVTQCMCDQHGELNSKGTELDDRMYLQTSQSEGLTRQLDLQNVGTSSIATITSGMETGAGIPRNEKGRSYLYDGDLNSKPSELDDQVLFQPSKNECPTRNILVPEHTSTPCIATMISSTEMDADVPRREVSENKVSGCRLTNPLPSGMCDGIKKVVETSTLHGVPRLTSKSKSLRIIWSLLVIGALCSFLWHIITLCISYLGFPVYVDVGIHDGLPTFPRITVCHSHMYKRSKLLQYLVTKNVTLLKGRLPKNYSDYIRTASEEDRKQFGYEDSDIAFAIAHTRKEGFRKYSLNTMVDYLPAWGNCLSFIPPKGTFQVDLIFNGNKRERLPGFLRAIQGHVFFNDPDMYPNFERPFISLETNKNYPTAFQLEIVNRLDGVYGFCQDKRDQDRFEKRSGLVYSNECKWKYAQIKCKCSIPPKLRLPSELQFMKLSGYQVCGETGSDCLTYQRYNRAPESKCVCKPQCRQVVYTFQTEETKLKYLYGKVRLRKFFKLPFKSNKKCRKWIKENLGILSLTAKSRTTKEFTHKPLYPLSRFISDIGGSMGFYLGASILTLFEGVHILSILFKCLLKRCVPKRVTRKSVKIV